MLISPRSRAQLNCRREGRYKERGYSLALAWRRAKARAHLFDHTERSGVSTIVIDDSTGSKAGIPLSDEMQKAMSAAELPLSAPSRGDNGNSAARTP
jgi:hypothetical protein